MTRTAQVKTPTPKRTARKAPAATKAAAPASKEVMSPRAKAKARAKLGTNPAAAKAVEKDLAEWQGRVNAAKTPIARAHTQAVLDGKRRTYGRPTRKQRGR
jgi:hypothetical protein